MPITSSRIGAPPWSGKLTLAVMSAAYTVFGLSLIFQASRWAATPAYHVLLQIVTAPVWGWLFLASGAAMGVSAWQFRRRWPVIAALTFAFFLTTGWMLAFVVRYLTNPDTTPVTWVSWAVFDYLLLLVALSIDVEAPALAIQDPALLAKLAGTREAMRQAGQDHPPASPG
jgi:hypothetical protein